MYNHPSPHEPESTRDADPAPPNFWRSRHALGFIVIGAVAGYYLLTEHLAHVLGALPFLLLLSCPLMHIFMHHGHGEHEEHTGHAHHHGGGDQSPDAARSPDLAKKRGESS